MHGPASITVTGIAVPFSPNTWVIPTFLPNNPLSISYPLFLAVGAGFTPACVPGTQTTVLQWLVPCPSCDKVSLQLDFDVHACGQIQSCQGLNCFVGRLNNNYQALMCANLKLLARIFINKR